MHWPMHGRPPQKQYRHHKLICGGQHIISLFISLLLIHTCRRECTQTGWQLPLLSMHSACSLYKNNVVKKSDIWHWVHQGLVSITPVQLRLSDYWIKSALHSSQHQPSQITLTTDTPLSIHQANPSIHAFSPASPSPGCSVGVVICCHNAYLNKQNK